VFYTTSPAGPNNLDTPSNQHRLKEFLRKATAFFAKEGN
jgi:hypothetical protein